MSIPNDASPSADEKLLYTMEIDQSLLVHECKDYVEALALLFASNAGNDIGPTNHHFANLFTSMAEKLDLLSTLHDFDVEHAELRLVAKKSDIPRRNWSFDPTVDEARKAAKEALTVARKAHREFMMKLMMSRSAKHMASN